EGGAGRPGREPPGGAHRGSPARIRELRGGDPAGAVRRRFDDDLGYRPVRDAEVGEGRGQGQAVRAAGYGGIHVVPDRGEAVDDAPGATTAPAGAAADAGRAVEHATAGRRKMGAGDEVGRGAGAGLRRARPGPA